ncbi:MAG: hypothetical protein V1904_14800 [Bacteroidota bacterium]
MKFFFYFFLLVINIPVMSFSQENAIQYPVLTVVENTPFYPGGQKAIVSLIKDNIVYPAEAKEKGT